MSRQLYLFKKTFKVCIMTMMHKSHSRRIKERSNRLHSEIPLVIGMPACKRSGKRNVEMNSDPNSTFCVCGGVDGKVDTARHVKGSFNVQGEINLW